MQSLQTTLTIRDIPVTFPFKPYDIQRDYMEKVIECLQGETNAVLESPTGTGKTLCLLCSSLGWLTMKKAQYQAHKYTPMLSEETAFQMSIKQEIDSKVGPASQSAKAFFRIPTIIYASRTHTQLSQAMQELKRTAYNHMKATVVGSREQLCINQEVRKEETNSLITHMCRLKLHTRSCNYYHRVEKFKLDPKISESRVLDIEDLVKLGQADRFCPYFMAKELKQMADIVFMPYNYVLDIGTRKALGIELSNTVVILDEAHNVDKICETTASVELKSSDIAICMEEVTGVMKAMAANPLGDFNSDDAPKDFNADELCALKQILMDLERAIDDVPIASGSVEGSTFAGDYVYELFKKANVQFENSDPIQILIDKIVQFLSTIVPEGPFARRGSCLEIFAAFLKVAFADPSLTYREEIKKCYKVHISMEETEKKQRGGNDWLSKKSKKQNGRILNFWCFSPGFGMNMLMSMGVKSVILTSGTLAPLAPLISELRLNVPIRLENPHVVKGNQICVKIVTKGPDGVELNSSYQNRDNSEYILSLGRTIMNVSRIIPGGLLIFFPSYPIMLKCQQVWQQEGIWSNICAQKLIYVEPKQKEAFNTAMTEYYQRINNPQYKGAIFMGVCRGKVSEGLDFADINGRGVIITGLPYPPYKDSKVVLKRAYMDRCRAENKSFASGQEWYTLEATRAVNQAIGRVIRHQNDYGAIILLDSRFTSTHIKSQLSMWLRQHIRLVNNFGEIIRDLKTFFRNAETQFPVGLPTVVKKVSCQVPELDDNSKTQFPGESSVDVKTKPCCGDSLQNLSNFDFSTSSVASSTSAGLVKLHDRPFLKRKRVGSTEEDSVKPSESELKEYFKVVKKNLNAEDFSAFLKAVTFYRSTSHLDNFTKMLDGIFLTKYSVRYLIQGLMPFMKVWHQEKFNSYWEKMR